MGIPLGIPTITIWPISNSRIKLLTKILVIDNYDSFTQILVGYLQLLNTKVTTIKNNTHNLPQTKKLINNTDGVIISPGPGNPKNAGICLKAIKHCGETKKPLLGVCLGHQALNETYGGTTQNITKLVHGKTSNIYHNQQGIFKNLPSPTKATRYHSLAIKTLAPPMQITATTDNIIMGIKHKHLPLEGIQFHPESILTENGHLMLANWLTNTIL